VIFTTRTAIVASIAWVATVAGLASATTPQFDDLRNQAPVRGDAAAGAAKAAACAACHGAKGIAAAPTFPNLAGQSETYLYVQLRAFKGGARVNAVMQPLAKTLADQDMRNLAAHFASLPGKAAPRTARESSRGSIVFHDGDAARGLPPCQGCHGADGKGNPALGAPNLTDDIWLYGGTPAEIEQTISNGRQGHMPAWSTRLSEDQIHVIAAYVYHFSHQADEGPR